MSDVPDPSGFGSGANKNMVTEAEQNSGMDPDRLSFNIARVGNTSAASIPLAIHDAVVDGVIMKPTRIFTPGSGAGAVAGYAVLRIDPRVVAPEAPLPESTVTSNSPPPRIPSSDDVESAFNA